MLADPEVFLLEDVRLLADDRALPVGHCIEYFVFLPQQTDLFLQQGVVELRGVEFELPGSDEGFLFLGEMGLPRSC